MTIRLPARRPPLRWIARIFAAFRRRDRPEALDQRMLQDIGLRRKEGASAFWDAPCHWRQ